MTGSFLEIFLDLYAFIFGACIIRGALVGGRYAIKLIQTKGMATFLKHIWDWSVIALRCSALASIWVQISYSFNCISYVSQPS